jgi:hypothetical protein
LFEWTIWLSLAVVVVAHPLPQVVAVPAGI